MRVTPARALTVPRYYQAEPSADLLRDALRVLRPTLATIWVETDAGPGGWPPELAGPRETGAELARRQTGEGRHRRPGHLASVAALDPGDDAEFELAMTLGPSSPIVEAISRNGQLCLQRKGIGQQARLRLSEQQRATLEATTPARLVPTRAPRAVGQAPWGPTVLLFLLGINAVQLAARAVHELTGRPSWFGWLWQGSPVLIGAAGGLALLSVVGVRFVRWARST